MAIDMTNVAYLVRYFVNGIQYCNEQHCFDYGENQPIIPRVGDRVALTTVPEMCFKNDEYADMPMHYYEVLGITYNMDNTDDGSPIMIDIEAIDVTDEVMVECDEVDDDYHCCRCGGRC